MTRIMYDGVTPASVPAGAALYAGYVDGKWPSYAALAAVHPSALHVPISVTAADDARVLDVETGDATPEQAPGWAERQRARGNPHPVVYMNESTWPAVREAFSAQGVAAPLYWVANYVDDPTKPPAIPAGAVAIQYYDYGGYDASLVADHWPGVDPAPAPTVVTTAQLEEDQMQIEPLSVHPGEYAFAFAPDKTQLTLVADGNDGAPGQLRIVAWVGDNPTVHDGVQVGGHVRHVLGMKFAAGTVGVTVRREDAGSFPIGVAFQ